MSIAGYGIVAAAIVLASCMQASIGFGMGMLAAPIVAIVDPGLIPGIGVEQTGVTFPTNKVVLSGAVAVTVANLGRWGR